MPNNWVSLKDNILIDNILKGTSTSPNWTDVTIERTQLQLEAVNKRCQNPSVCSTATLYAIVQQQDCVQIHKLWNFTHTV